MDQSRLLRGSRRCVFILRWSLSEADMVMDALADRADRIRRARPNDARVLNELGADLFRKHRALERLQAASGWEQARLPLESP